MKQAKYATGKIKSFGSEDSIHRVGGDAHPEKSKIYVHSRGKEILLTAYGLEYLTPEQATGLARRLMNAADEATRNVGDHDSL